MSLFLEVYPDPFHHLVSSLLPLHVPFVLRALFLFAMEHVECLGMDEAEVKAEVANRALPMFWQYMVGR